MCDRANCPKSSTHTVAFWVPTWGYPAEKLSCTVFYTGLTMCKEHAMSEARAAGGKTFPAESQGRISEVMRAMKKVPPDFNRMFGEIVALDSQEYKTFTKLAKKPE